MHVLVLLLFFPGPFCFSQYVPASYSAWFRNRDDFLLQHLRNFQIGNKNYTISPFKAKYFQALHFCHFYGMSLISIESKEENDNVQQHVLSFGFSNECFWTSGNKLADDRNWLWASSGKPVRFANWQYLEPNNKYGLEKCIELRQTQDGLVWNDVSCFDADVFKYFICDKKNEKCENGGEEHRVPVVEFMNTVHHQETTTTHFVANQENYGRNFDPSEDNCMEYSIYNSENQQIHVNINFD